MNNLKITIYLKTPLIPGKYPMNLDGLLYWSAFDGNHEDEALALDMVNRALASDKGVFKSSDLIYKHYQDTGISAQEAVFTTNFKWREFPLNLQKGSILETGGPYRARLTTYQSISCDAVGFYAVGDAKLIEFLIDSLGFIGRGNNQGHGEISEIVIEQIDEDLSWYQEKNGVLQLNRSLPLEVIESSEILRPLTKTMDTTLLRFKPPYTRSDEALGIMSEFKREIML